MTLEELENGKAASLAEIAAASDAADVPRREIAAPRRGAGASFSGSFSFGSTSNASASSSSAAFGAGVPFSAASRILPKLICAYAGRAGTNAAAQHRHALRERASANRAVFFQLEYIRDLSFELSNRRRREALFLSASFPFA